jgi:hypothetical protein
LMMMTTWVMGPQEPALPPLELVAPVDVPDELERVVVPPVLVPALVDSEVEPVPPELDSDVLDPVLALPPELPPSAPVVPVLTAPEEPPELLEEPLAEVLLSELLPVLLALFEEAPEEPSAEPEAPLEESPAALLLPDVAVSAPELEQPAANRIATAADQLRAPLGSFGILASPCWRERLPLSTGDGRGTFKESGPLEALRMRAKTPLSGLAPERRLSAPKVLDRRDSGLAPLLRPALTFGGSREQIQRWRHERGWKQQRREAVGAGCTVLTPQGGVISVVAQAASAPATAGGTFEGGTYSLTQAILYTGPGGASGPTGNTAQITVSIGTGTLTFVDIQNGCNSLYVVATESTAGD